MLVLAWALDFKVLLYCFFFGGGGEVGGGGGDGQGAIRQALLYADISCFMNWVSSINTLRY